MHFQYIPYLWLLSISLVILLFIAFFSLRYREITGAKAFSLCMLIFAFWTTCNGLEMAGTDLQTKLFWANMQYFSYTTINVFWLYMVLQFTGSKKWTSPIRILPLFIVPAIIIILVWTDQYHGLIRYGFTLDYNGSFPVIDKSYGPLYWIHPIYGYSILIFSILLIARAVFIYKSIYRMQAIALLMGPIICIIPSILYVLSLSPIERFDITPLFFSVVGIVTGIGIFRYQLFAVVPVARDVAVDHMNVGMLVIDNAGIVVDANMPAREQLEKEEKSIVGSPVKEAMSVFGDISGDLWQRNYKECKVFSHQSGRERHYEVQLLPVFNKRKTQSGSVILIRDVTEIKNAQLRILEQSRQLAVSRERERMARDLHDNLGQVLGFINLQAQGINNELRQTGVEIAADKLSKLIDVTQSAHKEIREYIHDARFSAVMETNFVKALLRETEPFKEQTGIDINLDIQTDVIWEALSIDKRNNMLYIIKEALNNIRKHSEAKNVQITFAAAGSKINVTVKDDGKGFDYGTVNQDKNKQYGLGIMQERAVEIGARLDIESIPEKGCTISLCIPPTEGEEKHVTESYVG